VLVYGPRRTGKTTMIQHFLRDREDYLLVSGEDRSVHKYLGSQTIETLKNFVGDTPLLVIDEAQHIPKIGLNLKLIVDHIPTVAVVATGSSSFDLANQVGEPLTGRKKTLHLYPLSQMELGQLENRAQTDSRLETRLIYGSYPDVVLLSSNAERRDYLHDLVHSALYKDILEVDGVKKAQVLLKLLQLLAYQVGKEVSHTELAGKLGVNRRTIERYLDLLEKVFIIVNIRGYSRNLRSEVTRTSRYYFYDLGIRNGLINNFNALQDRNDVGALWENYLVMERLKCQEYLDIYSNNYFWRTYDQKELDWVEERDGKLHGYEFKWSNRKVKAPKLWHDTYSEGTFTLINRENYLDFVAPKRPSRRR
jgi:uncharacterized protein